MPEPKRLSHAARMAYDRLAELLNLDLPEAQMVQAAEKIDAEFADVISALEEVWSDYARYGELKKSTIMRMQSAIAFVWDGEEGLTGLFGGGEEEG